MTVRVAWALAALVAVAGCATYRGGARSIDPARLSEPGWLVAAPTPEVQQPGEHDCGAAALAMIAGRWHVALSVQGAVAALPAPTREGTRLDDLRSVARAHGLAAFAIAGDRKTLLHELRARRPVIVGLLLPYGPKQSLSHYEVLVGAREADDEFVTINPAGGWRARSWAALDAEWRPAGRPTLVVLGPSAL